MWTERAQSLLHRLTNQMRIYRERGPNRSSIALRIKGKYVDREGPIAPPSPYESKENISRERAQSLLHRLTNQRKICGQRGPNRSSIALRIKGEHIAREGPIAPPSPYESKENMWTERAQSLLRATCNMRHANTSACTCTCVPVPVPVCTPVRTCTGTSTRQGCEAAHKQGCEAAHLHLPHESSQSSVVGGAAAGKKNVLLFSR